MSLDHAQTSFQHRWDQLAGASAALNRDAESFNDNNPNAVGHEIQLTFNFEFVVDETETQAAQEVPLPDLAASQDATEHEQLSSPPP